MCVFFLVDIVSSRPFPKSSRKREPVGASNFSKYDQPRKSFAQKGKSFDKRPKSKGYYNGSSKEDSKVCFKFLNRFFFGYYLWIIIFFSPSIIAGS